MVQGSGDIFKLKLSIGRAREVKKHSPEEHVLWKFTNDDSGTTACRFCVVSYGNPTLAPGLYPPSW